MYITIYSRRAALWDGPYDAAIRPQKRATNNEQQKTNNKKRTTKNEQQKTNNKKSTSKC